MKSFNFTKEGLPLDSEDKDERLIAAISAAILHISEKFIKEYGCGTLKRILIEAEHEVLVLEGKDKIGTLSILESNNGKIFLKNYTPEK
jgi:predicted regulator of Ras-like GTPase activity (Roadblock/LC7/MglB family)